jgi:hypothetical protein
MHTAVTIDELLSQISVGHSLLLELTLLCCLGDSCLLSLLIDYTCVCDFRMYVCMYVRMYVFMHVCMYACMYACMHVCTRAPQIKDGNRRDQTCPKQISGFYKETCLKNSHNYHVPYK